MSEQQGYTKFLQESCEINSKDPYAMMGYSKPEYAHMRYDYIYNQLIFHGLTNGRYSSLIDAGAGVGTMYDYFLNRNLLLDFSHIETFLLVEPTEKYIPKLSEVIARISNRGILPNTGFIVEQDPIEDCDHSADVVISVGALNYFQIAEFVRILQSLMASARKLLIFEVNLQVPDSSGGNGVYNPSIDTVYRIIYDYVLSDGSVSVDVHLFKKYTSIWTINYENKNC